MAIVTDMVVVRGDVNQHIGDSGDKPFWRETFTIENRTSGGFAVLMLMVKGLEYATNAVQVEINDQKVGDIFPNTGGTSHWSTQILNIGGSILKNGTNELRIFAVDWPGSQEGDLYDDFAVRDVVCFFQQDVAALPVA